MEKIGDRYVNHLVAWAVAVFVGVTLIPNDGKQLLITTYPFSWYTPLVWIFYAALVIVGSVLVAGIPAGVTALIAEYFPTWKKPQKALLFVSAFAVATVCVVVFMRFPS